MMTKPYELEQDSANTLRIVDANGEELCQFYSDADEVPDEMRAKAEFVLAAVNRAIP